MPPKPTTAHSGEKKGFRFFSRKIPMLFQSANAAVNAVPPTQDARGETIRHRCVCGTNVDLGLEDGGKCPNCDRQYSRRAVLLAATETIRLPFPMDDETPGDGLNDSLFGNGVGPEGDFSGSGGDDRGREAEEEESECTVPDDARLGHFRVIKRLGRGGMGEVYRALDESLQRYVAIKLLRPLRGDESSRDEALERLLEEARAQARVNHSGIVHIYYVSADRAQPFLAMELVTGGSLEDLMSAGPLSYGKTIQLAIEMAEALDHAARYDVVHGDIKPSNILINDEGRVKLGDFGLARRLSAGRQTPSTGLSGTPNYLAPEIARGGESDHRTDMYSLGVMLFEMTFGRGPYSVDSGSLREALEAHQSAPVEFPDPWPQDLPEGWRAVLMRLLEKSPEKRYDSYRALLADLERLRPIDMPSAGRVSRGFAWGVDLFLAVTAIALLLAPYRFLVGQGILPDSAFLQIVYTGVVSLFVTFLAAWLQALWKTSPGKAMFQLRIVDRHGLSPSELPLAMRAWFQLFPIWADDLMETFNILGADEVGVLAMTGVLAVSAVDAASALLRRDGQSVHDLLFTTRVVLDVRSTLEEEEI